MRRSTRSALSGAIALAIALGAQAVAVQPTFAEASQRGSAEIDAETHRQVFIRIAETMERSYADKAMGQAVSDSIRTYVDQGQADSATDAGSLVTSVSEMLGGMIPDWNFEFALAGKADEPGGMADEERSEHGLRTARTLEDGTAYLEFDSLPGARKSGPAVSEALAAQRQASAVILDVRDNNGGSGSMVVLLCSHFLEADALVYSFMDRSSGAPTEMRTSAPDWHFGSSVPVYVLTSGNTRSSAEALAFILQDAGRAVVVGERTAGIANPSRTVLIEEQFELTIPLGLLSYGKGGRTYSETGVIPDIEAPAESALEVALREIAADG